MKLTREELKAEAARDSCPREGIEFLRRENLGSQERWLSLIHKHRQDSPRNSWVETVPPRDWGPTSCNYQVGGDNLGFPVNYIK